MTDTGEIGPTIAGKYQILSKLGEGSFGNVLLVQHTELSTKYALKVLKKELSANEQFVARFKKEAEILLRFHHSGSVQLRDFGKTPDGLYYMATDFCEGTSLEAILAKQGRLEIIEALNIAVDIIEIIAAAHDFGIVHRDIKPGNIMLTTKASGKREVQILDFGIASLREEAIAYSEKPKNKPEEQHFNYGTPVYMSPEQCAGEPDIDPLTDIYASGIILYEMLAGWVPFDSQDVLQILLKHLTQPVPAFPKQFAIPLSVEEIVFKALEKDRTKRFASAQEFALACRQQISLIKPSTITKIPEVKIEQSSLPSTEPAKSVDKRILCLDDNEMILQIMQHLLQKEGYHVFIANNFANIHDYVFQENVPLLVCDVNMPGLPGNKICQMLKKAKPDLKIILFSNIPERDLERLAKESKADDWLSKNSKPNAWLEKIKTFF